jgi:hypothetical protein
MRLIVCLCFFLGAACASQQAKRDACYDAMDAAFEVRAETLCPGDGAAWKACAHRAELMDELATAYRSCR